MVEQHIILGGKVPRLQTTGNNNLWQCFSYFASKNRRSSALRVNESTVSWNLRRGFLVANSGNTASDGTSD